MKLFTLFRHYYVPRHHPKVQGRNILHADLRLLGGSCAHTRILYPYVSFRKSDFHISISVILPILLIRAAVFHSILCILTVADILLRFDAHSHAREAGPGNGGLRGTAARCTSRWRHLHRLGARIPFPEQRSRRGTRLLRSPSTISSSFLFLALTQK